MSRPALSDQSQPMAAGLSPAAPPPTGALLDGWYVASAAAAGDAPPAWRGPFAHGEMQRLIRDGVVTHEDRVWHPSFPAWAAAHSVPALFDAEAALAPAVALRQPSPTSRQGTMRRISMPSEGLPMAVLGIICFCFLMYFAGRVPLGAVSVSSLPAKPPRSNANMGHYDLEICNRTANPFVYVAVAYFDSLRGDWMARGWFPQRQDECVMTMRRLEPPVFVYAETADGAVHWGGDRGGPEFCIDRQKAFVVGQATCRNLRTATLQKFSELPLKVQADGAKRFLWEVEE